MLRHRLAPAVWMAAVVAGLSVSLAAQRPARDPAGQAPAPAGTGIISGYAVAADTGRPLKRVRILASGNAEISNRLTSGQQQDLEMQLLARLGQMAQRGAGPGGSRGALRLVRSAQTDDQGYYEIRELPPGKYTITASKTGFVDATFGQRRPLRPGTPLELADGQQIKNVSFSLPRGSVITGQILDEDGEPIARTAVTVMRYQYQNGQRRLVPAGSDQTDDRGMYRVYGLPPGDYFVSAVSRLLMRPMERLLQAMAPPDAEEGALGYAPTFYPGVTTPPDATRVSVALGQELGGVDFQLQLVPMARVSGTVLDAGGSPLAGGNVILVSDHAESVSLGSTIAGRVRPDGTFTIDNVPPGRYMLWARSRPNRDESANFAVHTLAVGGMDLNSLMVTLAPGATVSGSIGFDASTAQAPADLSRFRITMPALDPVPFGGNQNSRVAEDGAFELTGVPAGRRAIRVQNAPAPWSLKSVIVNGRDVTDEPIEVRSAQQITLVQVVFTDRVATLAGTITDQRNQPALGYTVILFSTDSTTWRPQSRTIMAVQPDQTGSYSFRGMPPGAYFLAAVDDVEQGEWYDPVFLQQLQPGAVRITINEGETTARDLRVDQ